MKHTKRMSGCKLLLVAMLVVLTVIGCMISAAAESTDIVFNLLTDKDAGFTASNDHGRFEEAVDENGEIYVHNHNASDGMFGSYRVHDYNNVFGSYRTFSLEGEFYFDALPSGLRVDSAGEKTVDQSPLSFICWEYKSAETGEVNGFNAVRIAGEGQLMLPDGNNGYVKKIDYRLEEGQWYKIRAVFTPLNGLGEFYINDEKVDTFNFERFDTKKHASHAVKYLDGYFEGKVKMKNLIFKSDSNYIIGLTEEDAVDYLAYQTSKPDANGNFSIRPILGVNSTEYNRVGYEVITLEKDGDKIVSGTISDRAKVVYESVKDAAGNSLNILENFGYNYAAAIEIPDLPVDPDSGALEIVIRPYVLGANGLRMYGVSAVLVYTGETDDEGYPVLDRRENRIRTVLPTDDTQVLNFSLDGVYGDSIELQIKNFDVENKAPDRAAYLKFTLDPETAKMIDTANSARLCLMFKVIESPYDIVVQGTKTDWTEDTLTYRNHSELAAAEDLDIYHGPMVPDTYFYVDILDYLFEQILNEDGSLTVSFRITNQGGPEMSKIQHALYLYSKEKGTDYTPYIEIVSTIYENELELRKLYNTGYEPWGYAEHLVNEWFDELYDKVYPKDENGNLITYDVEAAPNGYTSIDYDPELNGNYGVTEATGDFTTAIPWTTGYIWKSPTANDGLKKTADEWRDDVFGRTLSTLGTSTANKYLDSEYAVVSEYDVYGGIANAGFKGEATGFFHMEVINGRHYIIDPIGNPFFAVGVDDVIMYSKDWSLDRFGTEEAYYEYVSGALQDMGIYTAHVSPEKNLLAVEDGLNVVIDLSAVKDYMFSLGRSQVFEGRYPHNNTINVFDPDFVYMTNKNIRAEIVKNGYADNPRVLGYTADNEQPGGDDFLERYLTVDPSEPSNAFSYATAWTWLARKLNNPAITIEEYRNHPDYAKINSEFLAFTYTTYYGVVRGAIEAVDKNHMYMGSRVASNCRFDEGYLRAAGYSLDVITTNLYMGLNTPWDVIVNYMKYSGKPFIVTEFYAKSMDAIDDNGFVMANSTGAGDVVSTQEARAAYYEHQTMLLLESKACVGWTWYRNMDNDQPLHHSVHLEKDLVMAYVAYTEEKPLSYMDKDGNLYTVADAGLVELNIDPGDKIASNHNCNKGIFNRNYKSVVTVYTYDANGQMIDLKSTWVKDPASYDLADGTKLTALYGGDSFVVGRKDNSDGTYTVTKLTVYKGVYFDLARSMRNISDHVIGLVKYFDAE